MYYWNFVYPDAAEPTVLSKNERITQQGLNFVTNVIFESLGQNGVIIINKSSCNYLLVYHTTFIKPYYTKEGGAILFQGENCVQISVCSNKAYATNAGEHSAVYLPRDSNRKNEIVGCSIVRTIGKQSVFLADYGIQNFSNTNVTYCVGKDQAAWRFLYADSSSSQKYTTNCNITSTATSPIFGYQWKTKFDVNDSIFIQNLNQPGYHGIFYAHQTALNLYYCIIVDNIGEKLFSPSGYGSIKIFNCYLNNPNCPSNGAEYLSTDQFILKFSHFSTELCDVISPLYKQQTNTYYSDYCIFFIYASACNILL